ncbi:XRE family transcriptional regulator [Nocardia sp. NPDC046473]|uniref:XRE family transcriptional regulator n=1 Tax=Nocardia sp. NPDC046473 TaxID=3155733 RepID=UPI0033D71547
MATQGNAALRAARQALGYRSQGALADALTETARQIGLRIEVASRTVRRWESTEPPWPHPDHATALEALFKRPITELGFTPPWSEELSGSGRPVGRSAADNRMASNQRLFGASVPQLPASVATDYMAVTVSHRHLYWSVPAVRLHRSVAEHSQLGVELLPQVSGPAKDLLAKAVSESSLLAGRLEFFDLQQPELSQPSFVLALQAAHEAGDSLLGAAALAHMAFAPAFSGDASRAEEARERLRAARAFARRGGANAEMTAWLDAVEAEVETRFGDTRRALSLIHHAEEAYREEGDDEQPSPAWLDWFSPVRLAGFKGNTLMVAGRGREARETLEAVLSDLPEGAIKQRSIYLADVAAASVLENNPEQACRFLEEALDLLGRNWYATAVDRIKVVRQSLRQWDSLPAVRSLDERLYDWHTTVNSLVG